MSRPHAKHTSPWNEVRVFVLWPRKAGSGGQQPTYLGSGTGRCANARFTLWGAKQGRGERNTDAISLSLNLTAGWNPRNELVASIADWLAFRGRPSGRTVCSRPRSLTVSRTHFSSPYGHPLSMLTRTRSNSFVVKGALTRAVHFAGRSTDQVAAGEPQPSHARTPQNRTPCGTFASCRPIGSGRDRQSPGATLAVLGMTTSAHSTEGFRQY